MNYPVKWFSSEMPGAPVINGHPGAIIGTLDAVLINGWGLVSVDSLVFDSVTGEATLTVAGGHGFIVDQVILISGANEAEFNGEQRVIWADSTTIKFNPVHLPSVATASGSITAKVAPQGSWAKPHSSGDNLKAIYQSSSPNRLSSAGLYIDDSNTHQDPNWNTNGVNTLMQAFDSFSDLDTRNGLMNSDQNYQCIRKAYSTNATYFDAPSRWYVVADERLVYLFVNHMTHSDTAFMNCHVFGELISYKAADDAAFFIAPGYQGGAAYYSTSYFPYMKELEKARSVQADISGANATGYIGYKGMNFYQDYMGYGNFQQFPAAADNGLYLADRVYIWEGKDATIKLRGELPGLGYPLHPTPFDNGRIDRVAWRGGETNVLAVTMPLSVNQQVSGSKAQCFIDIEGPWRA